jgi:hypothetical protein
MFGTAILTPYVSNGLVPLNILIEKRGQLRF